jgi:hypothetical protein
VTFIKLPQAYPPEADKPSGYYLFFEFIPHYSDSRNFRFATTISEEFKYFFEIKQGMLGRHKGRFFKGLIISLHRVPLPLGRGSY